jgi:hypothetical protein
MLRMAKKTKKTKDRVPMFTEVPPALKQEMERLAEEHNRSLAGEVITALQRYVAQEAARAKEEQGGT